jgi:anti-sigma B factor antagonist
VGYISSVGFRVLLATLKECRAKNGDLVIVAPQKNIVELLEMSGFTNLLKVYPSVEEAVTKLGA